jgi:putative ABC transport system permease protein
MSLHLKDIDYLQKKIPDIDYISPQSVRGNFGTPGDQISRNGKKNTYMITGDFPVGNQISKKNYCSEDILMMLTSVARKTSL